MKRSESQLDLEECWVAASLQPSLPIATKPIENRYNPLLF